MDRFVFRGVGVFRVDWGLCGETIVVKGTGSDGPPFEHLEETNRGS